MDKPLALEYSGEKKWYSYRMFEPLQDDQSDSESNRKFDRSKQVCFEVSSLASGEEEKQNHNENANSNDSFCSSSSNQDKLDSHYCKTNYESLRIEIKELRNDLKTCMKKIAAPLNIIANFITQNHAQKFESTIRESSIPTPENAQEINQADVVIHTVEDYQKVRDKYPFEIFVRNELAHLDSKSKKEYSKMLKLAVTMNHLHSFCFRNQSLTLKTIKSFVNTYKEYSREYREFDLQMLKSIYIEKDFKQSESQLTLIKKWKQWRRICVTSFGIPNDKFPEINFSSNTHSQKDIKFNKTKKIIESTCKTLKVKSKIGDALLVQLIFTLGLKISEIRLLSFEDVSNQEEPKLKVSNSKKGSSKLIVISEDLYNEIKNYKTNLIKKGKYDKSIRQSTISEQIIGHFMFNDLEYSIIKKLKSNFGETCEKFCLKLSEPREVAIKEINCCDKNVKKSEKYR